MGGADIPWCMGPSTDEPIYKGGGKNRHCPSSYCGIYLLNTLTELFEGLIESRLSQFTEKHDTLHHEYDMSQNECDITHNERDMTHYSGTCLTR